MEAFRAPCGESIGKRRFSMTGLSYSALSICTCLHISMRLLNRSSLPTMFSLSHNMADTPSSKQQADALFLGNHNPRCAALCIYRYNRIAHALSQFFCGDIHDQTRQRQWRIGLISEVVSLVSSPTIYPLMDRSHICFSWS